jgi:aminoacrylate hydrolase
MPYLELSDCRLWWEEHGSGPPLLFVAGLGGVATYWEPQVEFFAKKFRVILHDQRGSGRSSHVVVNSVEQMAEDAVQLMDSLGIASVLYVGHSTGGAIGTAIALAYPGRISRLVINSSTTKSDPYRYKVFDVRKILHRHGPAAYAAMTSLLLYPPWYINANNEILAAEEAQTAKVLAPPEVQNSRLDAILAYDRTGELAGLDLPTLVLCARDDILTPAYFSEELARLIPNARLHLLPTGGHACSRTMTEEFNKVVLEFLTGAE